MRFPFTGVIPVDKPRGVTSRKVVDAVARAAGMKTVGHAGTLDPLATGVMVVCVGHATKLVDHIHSQTKHYSATFLLGRSSPSDDFETPIEEEAAPLRPSRELVESAAAAFRGECLQRPCDYSAVHVEGKRAYRLARKGRPLELPLKRVRIDQLVITDYQWPRLALDVECSAGTFIRAIGRDLAVALGTRAVMESLIRTAVGPFQLADAVPLAHIDAHSLRSALRPSIEATPHLPRYTLDDDSLALAVRGGLLPADTCVGPEVLALDSGGDLVGLLRRLESGALRLRPNFRGEG
ncbi:MAG: tRNA pseudouridine(55) synthase TruB [Planctomycetota bacterium]|nr:MAG: tRNA pseudouridine(55) synthase TruB [Planctomycetota bacterium]